VSTTGDLFLARAPVVRLQPFLFAFARAYAQPGSLDRRLACAFYRAARVVWRYAMVSRTDAEDHAAAIRRAVEIDAMSPAERDALAMAEFYAVPRTVDGIRPHLPRLPEDARLAGAR
jgi:hypothetical protein